MTWTAIIPVRLGAPRKTRLSGSVSAFERERLADLLFAHVARTVRTHQRVAELIILSPLRPPGSPDGWKRDDGRGLNEELTALRDELSPANVLVVHADLPLIGHSDLTELMDAAESAGIALAPDHAAEGTNAVAIRQGQPFSFAFGPGSLAAHRAAARVPAGTEPRLVVSRGLAHDIDLPSDLTTACAAARSSDGGAWRWNSAK